MSLKITDYIPTIKANTAQRASIFLRMAAEELQKSSHDRTPKKTGRLRADVVKQVLGLHGKVVWGKNYSARQETTQFRNYTTAGTGSKFAENAAKALPDKTMKIAKSSGLL